MAEVESTVSRIHCALTMLSDDLPCCISDAEQRCRRSFAPTKPGQCCRAAGRDRDAAVSLQWHLESAPD